MADIEPTFACDAMLGGLARWLRAAGYDASWTEGIADWDLVRLAQHEGRLLLSSDTGIFRIGVVRDGDVPALFVPHGMSKSQQLAFVLRELDLRPLPPRCMACGGTLREVPPQQAQARVPPRTFAWVHQFFECRQCGRLFWPGSHWQRIAETLRQAAEPGGSPDQCR